MGTMLAAAPTVGASSLRNRWVIQRPSGGSGGTLVSLSAADFCSNGVNARLPLVHLGRNAIAIVDGVLSPVPSPPNSLLPYSTLAVSPTPLP